MILSVKTKFTLSAMHSNFII